QSCDILISHIEDDLIAVVFAATANRHGDGVAARHEVSEAEDASLINRLAATIADGFIAIGLQHALANADPGNGLSRSFVYYAPGRFIDARKRGQFDVDVLDHPAPHDINLSRSRLFGHARMEYPSLSGPPAHNTHSEAARWQTVNAIDAAIIGLQPRSAGARYRQLL